MKFVVFILFLIQFSLSFTQINAENVFLERKYWTEKPSLEKIQTDIDLGNDPSAFNSHKFDAVTWAILEKNSHDVIWFLLNQEGNDVNRRSHDGRTPIFWAAYKGNLSLMKSLAEKNAKMDLKDDHGYSLVSFAASTGQLNFGIYEFCELKGSDLSTERAKNGATPLLLLMPFISSNSEIDFFTSRGLSIEEVDDAGSNAFVYAAKTGNQFMMNYLLTQGIDPNVNNGEAIRMAIKGTRSKKNDRTTYAYLVDKGVSANGKNKANETVFHLLANRNADTLDFNYFIDLGISLDTYDMENNHPIHKAIESANLEVIQFLLKKSPEVQQKAKGENLIHSAVKRGDTKILQFLLENIAHEDLNTLSKEGLTPLHLAAMTSKDVAMLKLLIDHGAKKEIRTEFGETAFVLAQENELLRSTDVNLNFLK